MTLDKAIKILEAGKPANDGFSHWDYDCAIKLGKEALKRVRDHRHCLKESFYYLLLGETEE